jgi:hypothetical protein
MLTRRRQGAKGRKRSVFAVFAALREIEGEFTTGARRARRDELEVSLNEFRRLSELTARTYESISDVPMWYPMPELKKCPFHWTDILPYYEKEFDIARHNAALIRQAPRPVGKRAKESFFKRKLTAEDF